MAAKKSVQLSGVAVAQSSICSIDPDEGVLMYRGYDIAEIPPALAPAMFACSRVAGWSAHILEQKRTGRLFRPSAKYVGPAARSLSSV